ncbi:MAG: TapB family protein [Gammaproteobacteria bacterium]
MTTRTFQTILAAVAILVFSTTWAKDKEANSTWQEEFGISKCNLLAAGRNQYFVLEPGFQLVLQGGDTKLQITVLNETKMVDGVVTRVVEEREWKDGKLYEVARNYFAMCEQTKDVFYFGEDVDYYENDKVVKHDGTWHAGTNGNRAGLMMAGTPKLKMKYYQELAPGVAMDRAEIVSLNETCKTPAGTFTRCMKVKEGSAIAITAKEYKYYAPGIGLIRDESLRLIKYGFIKN